MREEDIYIEKVYKIMIDINVNYFHLQEWGVINSITVPTERRQESSQFLSYNGFKVPLTVRV